MGSEVAAVEFPAWSSKRALLTRAVTATPEAFSATFGDGKSGRVEWAALLAGTGMMAGAVRADSIRTADDGKTLEVEITAFDDSKPPKQLPDRTLRIPAEIVREHMKMAEAPLMHFQVQGLYGPMTLTFKALGRHSEASKHVSDERACQLTVEEVQKWYERRGHPRSGTLHTKDEDGYFCGIFQMM